ncbi:hypothetical protein GJ496_003554 [Pomphorhynchus laevis]|nr:hypothetical protein GJ496_003554 [Pomphorhynchus laevis]
MYRLFDTECDPSLTEDVIVLRASNQALSQFTVIKSRSEDEESGIVEDYVKVISHANCEDDGNVVDYG